MPISPYLPHIIYSTAITSLSLHLLVKRKQAAELRRQADARISILEEIVSRLRSGDTISDVEIDRLRRLGREGLKGPEGTVGNVAALATERNVDWKTVVLGRPTEEKKDAEEKFMKAIASASSDSKPSPIEQQVVFPS